MLPLHFTAFLKPYERFALTFTDYKTVVLLIILTRRLRRAHKPSRRARPGVVKRINIRGGEPAPGALRGGKDY